MPSFPALRTGIGKKRLQDLLHSDGARAGSASTMRRCECLVQIDMQDIDAEIAGPRDADHRVQIRAIHVDQRAMGVYEIRNRRNVALKDSQGVGIGDHHRCDIVAHRLTKSLEVDGSLRVRRDLLDDVAGDRDARRIRAVGRIRHQDLRRGFPRASW